MGVMEGTPRKVQSKCPSACVLLLAQLFVSFTTSVSVLGPAMPSESAASPAMCDANHCSKDVSAYRYTFEYPASWKNDVVNKVSFAHLYVSGMQASSHFTATTASQVDKFHCAFTDRKGHARHRFQGDKSKDWQK